MIKLMSFLKKYSLHILVVIALLFAQAALELSLPDYMSKIVNVGIQQGGIESPYPEVIRESEVTLLDHLMTQEETEKFKESYTLFEGEDPDLLKDYPVMAEVPVYRLTGETDDASLSYLNPYLLMMYGLRDVEQAEALIPGGDFSQLPPGVSPIQAISMMPEAEKRAFIDTVLEKLSIMPEAVITQTAALYTRGEYEALGADLNQIQTDYVLMAGLQMIGIAFLAMLVAVSVSFIASRVSAFLGRDLRSSLFRKVASFNTEEYGDFSTASLITRSTNDIQQVQMFSVLLLRMVFFAPILGIGGIIKALNTNRSMAWVIAVGVMAILTVVVIMFATALPKFKRLQTLVDKVNMVVRDSLVGLMVIRAFNTERHEEKKFDVANKDLTKTNLFVSRLMGVMQPLMMLIMNALSILIVWVGSSQVDLGNMQVGDMMAYIQYTMQIMMSFLMLSMVSIILPRAMVSMNRIGEVLDKEVSILDPLEPKTLPAGIKGEIEFKDVSFKYPGAEDCVLENISFKAHNGQTTAFIGSTGSGKSTLVNLIPRFYDVTRGEILLNGVNIKDIPLKELRRRISYVPQKGILFSGTAETNIKYADEHMSDEKMRKAARIAQAEDFINEKEDKFDFSIAQGGSNVSGGQRQRLSIARALAADAEAIIFDDSFSALDYKTDSKLRATLKKEVNNTVIIVAQRISTIKTADRIIVLDEGKIVGQGTHEELLKDCPVYIEIAKSQLSKEEMAS
ncbi:ABC transporter ATP-binding protein [Proteiniclasticum sp. SCR006]|uniref:ABC transporter ATP-binding protein n=1 Tax=Proteiniclasticum aestuarii TaxID=2817862 RepID=A0A939KKS8_9CLOT|nr:ABC transporter ATP-binding protein [Proteiniclasticum aestuarii]MBO1264960.1 ABC transporter ATP-binding protein [Proteiniclasticum aestuarii]